MSYRMECDCCDYSEQVKQIDSCIELAWVHNYKLNIIPFIYCPWCGKKLKKIIIEEVIPIRDS